MYRSFSKLAAADLCRIGACCVSPLPRPGSWARPRPPRCCKDDGTAELVKGSSCRACPRASVSTPRPCCATPACTSCRMRSWTARSGPQLRRGWNDSNKPSLHQILRLSFVGGMQSLIEEWKPRGTSSSRPQPIYVSHCETSLRAVYTRQFANKAIQSFHCFMVSLIATFFGKKPLLILQGNHCGIHHSVIGFAICLASCVFMWQKKTTTNIRVNARSDSLSFVLTSSIAPIALTAARHGPALPWRLGGAWPHVLPKVTRHGTAPRGRARLT